MLILETNLLAEMSDEHLIAGLRAEAGPLTSTAAEVELLGRLETALDALADLAPFGELVDEFGGITPADFRAVIEAHAAPLKIKAEMLALLNDLDIVDAAELKELLTV